MKKLLLAAVCAATFAAPAFAATDGSLSTTSSSGTVTFTTNIPNMVRVSGLNDMTINVTPAMLTEPYHSREDASDNFCVYSNAGANGNYKMSVSATPLGGNFALTGPGSLRYLIWLSDDPANQFKHNAHPGSSFASATTAGGLARPATLDCSDVSGGANASIHVGVDDTDLLAAVAGTYSDTITVTVSVP